MKTRWTTASALLAISAILIFFYRSSFTNFFFQDDFFNIRLSQSQSLISAFNITQKPILDFFFYRPLTTQAFWKIGQTLFGFNPFPYHLVLFAFFLLNIYLVAYLANFLFNRRSLAILAAFIYAFSGSHFYRLYFLSQFQEIALATFSLLTIILYIKKNPLAILTLIISFTCKETAIVTPFVLLSYDVLIAKKSWKKLLVLTFTVSLLYLIARKFLFGLPSGGIYTYNFSLKSILNNLSWYFLWALGLPEAYVNLKIFKLPTLINPKIFTEFGPNGSKALGALMAFLYLILISLKSWWSSKNNSNHLLFGLSVFSLYILPVAFFPFHKFGYSLTLPLVGVTIVLACLLNSLPRILLVTSLIFYFVLFYFGLQFNLTNHWVTKRAETSKQVFNYFKNKSQIFDKYPNIYFRNNTQNFCQAYIPAHFKFSQEVAYGIGGVDGLQLFYHNPNLKIYFEDFDINSHLLSKSLMIDSRIFLK